MDGPARGRRAATHDDRGGAVVQLPIMAGTYVLFVLLLVLVGRVNSGHSAAEAAATPHERSPSHATPQPPSTSPASKPRPPSRSAPQRAAPWTSPTQSTGPRSPSPSHAGSIWPRSEVAPV